MHSNKYTFIYSIVICVITAVALSFSSEYLKPFQDANIALDTKTSILRSVHEKATERTDVEKIYTDKFAELVVDGKGNVITNLKTADVMLKDEIAKSAESRRLPLYIYTATEGKKYYVIPVRGTGLWGPIWGYISISDDFNTIYGAYFDHKGETPGLGAEISEKQFQDQFQGKKIMEENNFVSVRVVKKGEVHSVSPAHVVDGVSGGTITSKGTEAMLKNCIAPYLPYFKTITNQ